MMGDVDAAIELLRQNVSDHPASAECRFGLGRALRTAGRREEALRELSKALTIDPEHRRTKNALAELAGGENP